MLRAALATCLALSVVAADAPKRSLDDWLALMSFKANKARDAAIRETAADPARAREAVTLLVKHLRDNKERRVTPGISWPRSTFLGMLGRLAQAAPGPLLDGLDGADAGVRASIAHACACMEPPPAAVMAPLLKLLSDEDKQVRREASYAFRKFGEAGKEAVPALIVALDDSDERVRWGAAGSLWGIGTPAMPALRQALKDGKGHTASYAALAVSFMGPKGADATPELAEMLRRVKEPSWAIEACARIGPGAKEAAGSLGQHLSHPREQTRQSVVAALIKMGPGAEGAIPALMKAHRVAGPRTADDILRAIRGTGKAAIPWLLDALRADAREPGLPNTTSEILSVHIHTAWGGLLVDLGKEVVPVLAEYLLDPDEKHPYRLAALLGRIGPDAASATPKLIDAVKSRNVYLRREALLALGQIGPGAAKAAEAVRAVVRGPVPNEARLAAGVLGRIGDDAGLVALAKDEDAGVRNAALSGLLGCATPPKDSAPILLAALGDAAMRQQAARALTRCIAGHKLAMKEAVKPLLATVGSKDEGARLAAIETLAALGPTAADATETLEAISGDMRPANRAAREAALRTLKAIRAKK